MIDSEDYNQVCVLSVNGDFGGEACAAARRVLEERIDSRQIVDFVVDMEKCESIDSEGLETLLWMKRRCEDLFGQFKLAGLDENCRMVLEITRLDHRFDSQADLAAALKGMR